MDKKLFEYETSIQDKTVFLQFKKTNNSLRGSKNNYNSIDIGFLKIVSKESPFLTKNTVFIFGYNKKKDFDKINIVFETEKEAKIYYKNLNESMEVFSKNGFFIEDSYPELTSYLISIAEYLQKIGISENILDKIIKEDENYNQMCEIEEARTRMKYLEIIEKYKKYTKV